MPLTPAQALQAARDLKNDFGSHADQELRRLIRQRKNPVDWEALGLEARAKDIAPVQTHTPAEEAHRYANAIASAEPEVAVFVAESEKVTRQKIGARLEDFWDAAITTLLGDDYERCLHMSAEGVGAGRLDLKPQFWSGIPERGDLESEPYNAAVDDQRKAIGLPFEAVTLDPLTFYYEEDKRREIVVGVEWGRRKKTVLTETYKKHKDPEAFLGPTIPEGISGGTRMVDFVVVRTPDIIYHAIMGNDPKGSKDHILWEGPNLFAPSTGYILWRGLPSGYPEVDERYLPFIMQVLANAPHKNLHRTIQNNLAILSLRTWTEEPKESSRPLGQQVAAQAKGTGATKKSRHGNVVADVETGRVVRWRDMAEGSSVVLAHIEEEELRYRFPEPLAPESSSGESGRDTIRRQEVSWQLLRQGYESRKRAIEELITIVRRTLFGHKEFLQDGRMVYLQHLVEGLGEEGTLRKQDLLALSEEDNIPHEVQVTIQTMTQAAQLAMNEEGIRLQGHLSQETRDQDYFSVKNIPLENRRRQKDLIRAATYPETVKRAILAVNDRLGEHIPPGAPDLVVPEGGGAQPPGPAVSAQPTPSQPEDVGTMISTNGVG